MNAGSGQLSVERQLFSELSLLTTIVLVLARMAILDLTLAFDSPTTLLAPPNHRSGPWCRGYRRWLAYPH